MLIEEAADGLAAVGPLDVGLLVEVLVTVSFFCSFGRMVVIVSLVNSLVAVVSVVEDGELADDSDVVFRISIKVWFVLRSAPLEPSVKLAPN